jgi:Penicillinase repressor
VNRILEPHLNGQHKPAPSIPPASPPVADQVGLLLDNLALQALLGLPPGWRSTPIERRREANGAVVIVRLCSPNEAPATISRGRLSTREKQVIATVTAEHARLNRGVQGAEVFAAMEAAGTEWGESTINKTLAKLAAKGYLRNEHDGKGYFVDPV